MRRNSITHTSASRTVVFHTLVVRSINHIPGFTNGAVQSWNVNANTSSPINALLQTQDADVSQILTYSVVAMPAHGTLNGFPATAITNNGTATPSGLTYTATAGYSGADQFIIKVSVGSVSTQTTINVNVLGVLPVTLTHFSVGRQQGTAVIKWTTALEINTAKFEVEHSKDGMYFTTIATIAAKGTATGITQYSKTDNFPARGWNYYRLKLIDRDGRITISAIRLLNFELKDMKQLIVYPNPVIGRVINMQVNADANNYNMNLYNQQGQKVFSQKISVTASSNTQIILPKNIVAGIYNLLIESGDTRLKQTIVIF